jgi:hypothetical protein
MLSLCHVSPDAEGPGGPGGAFDPATLFTPGQDQAIAQLQRLLVALTGLQQAEDRAALDALAQVSSRTGDWARSSRCLRPA